MNVALASRTTLEVGGSASYLECARSEVEVAEALEWARARNIDVHVLGGGSNLVVADAGVRGLVLELGIMGTRFDTVADHVVARVGAGEPWDGFVAAAVERNLQGVECLSGIPGRVGSTPIQNVGAYGQEVAETILEVRVFDRQTGAARVMTAGECGFGYRDSVFKSGAPNRYVVLEVAFRLQPDALPTVRYPELARRLEERGPDLALIDVRDAVLALRRSKSMVIEAGDPNRRSCGSFFLNPVVTSDVANAVQAAVGAPDMPRYAAPNDRVKLSAAWLIERAGFSRGERSGSVGLSSKHTLAIVCHEGARADDVVRFARRIRDRVAARFGVRLVPEPNFWGFDRADDELPQSAEPTAP
jgi:UDP-N-acetylmuramate dehydrogenase